MDKIIITITKQGDKQYAVFHVNPMFDSKAFWASYHDLPRDETRVEVRLGDEFKLIAEIKEKIAEAEVAIARHEEFMSLSEETRTLEADGHLVTVHFKPWYDFSWKSEVSIPRAMKNEIDQPSLLGVNFDDEDGWENRDCSFTLSKIVKDKEEYFEHIQAEMSKAAKRIEALREWRAQPARHYELPGDVSVTIMPDECSYKAEVIAPKSLIEKAKLCGLKLGQRTWGSKNDHARWWCPLRNEAEATRVLAKLSSEIEETLQTEIIAQHSVN